VRDSAYAHAAPWRIGRRSRAISATMGAVCMNAPEPVEDFVRLNSALASVTSMSIVARWPE
jgi:hypothetical protein